MTRKIILCLSVFCLVIINIVLDMNINNYINLLNNCFSINIVLTDFYYTLICSIIAFISILIIIVIKLVVFSKKDEIKGINLKSEDGTYGTADWLSDSELNTILGKNDAAGLILGKKNNDIIKLPFNSFFNKNIAVFGSSGSMKTIGFLLTNILELSLSKKSIIITDPKGEIFRITSAYFKSIGYNVKVLNLNDMKHSDRWNPLLENEDINDVQTSANVIITNTQRTNRRR